MAHVQLVVAGLLAVTILAVLADRASLPHAAVLMLGGLAIGFVPGTPDVRLDPEIIFLVFLPPIIYSAAFAFAAEDIRGNLRPIGFLAIGLVLATVGGVAVAAHFVLGIGWTPAFVLGAIVAPTDPVAATAVLRRIGAPARIATVLEGESLVNDGTGLSVFALAVATAGAGSFAVGSGLLDFFTIALGGSGIGLASGWLSMQVRRRLEAPMLSITLALATAYGAFLIADELEVSGILAAVCAGIVVGRRSLELGSPEMRLQSEAFWQAGAFVSESLLFLLIGLEFQVVLEGLNGAAPKLAGEAALVVGVVIGLRVAWAYTVPYLLRIVPEPLGTRESRMSAAELGVVSLAGMRGAVTVAAALSIPVSTASGPFPDRELLIFLGYVTVFGTLVPVALALPLLLKALGLAKPEKVRRQGIEARLRVAHAALERAEELGRKAEIPEEALRRARDIYEMRIARGEAEVGEDGDAPGADVGDAYRRLRRELLAAERAALTELRAERAVPGEALREIERELNLEEARLRS